MRHCIEILYRDNPTPMKCFVQSTEDAQGILSDITDLANKPPDNKYYVVTYSDGALMLRPKDILHLTLREE